MLCLGGKPGILWQHPGSGSRSRVAQCLWDSVKTQCVFFFLILFSERQHRTAAVAMCHSFAQTNLVDSTAEAGRPAALIAAKQTLF